MTMIRRKFKPGVILYSSLLEQSTNSDGELKGTQIVTQSGTLKFEHEAKRKSTKTDNSKPKSYVYELRMPVPK